MLVNVAIIAIVSLIVQYLLRRDFAKGIAAAVFFLVLLPIEIRIEMPGAIPELTVHRVILLIVLLNVWPKLQRPTLAPVSRLVLLLVLAGIARLLSTLTAIDPGGSFKVVAGFLIETVLYFVLLAAALQDRRSVELVLWSSLLALVTVGGLAVIERRTGVNLPAQIIPGMVDSPRTVSVTFRHRILFGYAMAMGFPLALCLRELAETKGQRRLTGVAILLLPAACYFGGSRGPWVGCALGAGIAGCLAGKVIWRKLSWLGLLAGLALIVRPGVAGTIWTLWEQSFNDSTIKGKSAEYRMKLWSVASQELSKSFEHTLFGYGGHSTELMDLGSYFAPGGGGQAEELGHTSWDSQYASDFMQYGFVGFGLEVLLYLTVAAAGVKAWRASRGLDRFLITGCVAAGSVFLLAMATVAIFNAQLEFLFWTLVAVCGRFHWLQAPVVTPVEELAARPTASEDGQMSGSAEPGLGFE